MFFYLKERVRTSHVLTLRDGTVLRLGPHEKSGSFDESLISDEVLHAERLGIVSIHKIPDPNPVPVPVVAPVEEAPAVPSEVPAPSTKPVTPRLTRGGKK